MKRLLKTILLLLPLVFFTGCETQENVEPSVPPVPSNIVRQPEGEPDFNVSSYAEWAGCRSSIYGMDKFPNAVSWTRYAGTMASFYKKTATEYSTGTLVWLVGTVTDNKTKSCYLNFPKPKGVSIPSGIEFGDEDENEWYLNAFDEAGYSVWLQVESGFVDIEKLAAVVMTKYKHHPCVKGFGIDVEWYQNITDGKPGTKLTDEIAEKVDKAVKKINGNYSVFVKHWRKDFLPENYRGVKNDMIFVTDSQGFDDKEDMTDYYTSWAEYYEPNPVFFQIGYYARPDDQEEVEGSGSDEKIWKSFNKPLQEFGQFILDGLENNGQKRGIIWVDFTLKDAYIRSTKKN